MYGNLIFLVLFIAISGQRKADEREYPIARFLTSRTSNNAFETQFNNGRCPQRFYQLGDECIYFANDGKSHAWKRAEKLCSGRIAGILNEPSAGNAEQPNMQPTKGVRQLVLNTPEKTEMLRALLRDYAEQNFAVRLPSDYNTLQRCQDGQDDKWPQLCPNSPFTNSTCFETIAHGPNDICLREIDCNARYLRLTCEFTLPGSPELIYSKFRNCPPIQSRRGRLPKWAWILIIVGSALLALIILGAIFACVRKSRGDGARKKKSLPEPRQTPEKVIRVPLRREERVAEPLLIRAAPTTEPDSGYLEPRSLREDNAANA